MGDCVYSGSFSFDMELEKNVSGIRTTRDWYRQMVGLLQLICYVGWSLEVGRYLCTSGSLSVSCDAALILGRRKSPSLDTLGNPRMKARRLRAIDHKRIYLDKIASSTNALGVIVDPLARFVFGSSDDWLMAC